MIVVYPMLVSKSVSKVAIPGIMKVLERYILIYELDQIISTARQSGGMMSKGQYKIKRGRLTFKEGFDPEDVEPGTKEKAEKKKAELEKAVDRAKIDKTEIDRQKWEAQKKSAKVDVSFSDMQSLSLEPTYMKVDVQDKEGVARTELIGVKVVPVYIKSDEELVHLMLYDKHVGTIRKKVINVGRRIIRRIRHISDRLWSAVPIFGGGRGSPSGDPRQDILMQRSAFEKRLFVLINRINLDDEFFQSTNRINRLYNQGWCSFIIADDVNKIVSFCLKNMKGMCSMIHYSTMYNTLGHLKVFESLEDARRSSASLFKISKSEKKIFGESLANVKRSNYQQVIRG